jgi:DNA-binding transcriptional LysR family regulator
MQKMPDMDWDDIRFFLTTARSGSLTAASRRLGSQQSTVGRRIDALEKSLGLRLFQRHAQGLTLTDDGRRILHAAEAMDAAANTLLRMSVADTTDIHGSVRIAAPQGLGAHLIAPHLIQMHARYPRLDITLHTSAASSDLTHGEADIAVRLFRPDESELVVRRAGEMGLGLYAARTYLENQGTPVDTADFPRHRYIGYGEGLAHLEENRWLQDLVGDARFVLRCDDTLTRMAAVETGLGLAVLPHFLARRMPQLQRVGREEAPPKTIWLVMHQDLRHVARVRAVLDWLGELLAVV